MPRMNIYVPDALKARMDEAGDENWSNVAQAAFEGRLLQINSSRLGDDEMDAVIERLRDSKARSLARQQEVGKRVGREWAKQFAGYDELEAVATYEDNMTWDDVARAVFGPDGDMQDMSDWWSRSADNPQPSDDFVIGFVEGAAEVWEQVADKI